MLLKVCSVCQGKVRPFRMPRMLVTDSKLIVAVGEFSQAACAGRARVSACKRKNPRVDPLRRFRILPVPFLGYVKRRRHRRHGEYLTIFPFSGLGPEEVAISMVTIYASSN